MQRAEPHHGFSLFPCLGGVQVRLDMVGDHLACSAFRLTHSGRRYLLAQAIHLHGVLARRMQAWLAQLQPISNASHSLPTHHSNLAVKTNASG
jgi:hypothetical protein